MSRVHCFDTCSFLSRSFLRLQHSFGEASDRNLNVKTMRTWQNDLYADNGSFSESRQGKNACTYVPDDEECRKACEWVSHMLLWVKNVEQVLKLLKSPPRIWTPVITKHFVLPFFLCVF